MFFVEIYRLTLLFYVEGGLPMFLNYKLFLFKFKERF